MWVCGRWGKKALLNRELCRIRSAFSPYSQPILFTLLFIWMRLKYQIQRYRRIRCALHNTIDGATVSVHNLWICYAYVKHIIHDLLQQYKNYIGVCEYIIYDFGFWVLLLYINLYMVFMWMTMSGENINRATNRIFGEYAWLT